MTDLGGIGKGGSESMGCVGSGEWKGGGGGGMGRADPCGVIESEVCKVFVPTGRIVSKYLSEMMYN